MIARISFDGVVREELEKKRSVIKDHVDIHVGGGLKEAKELFLSYVAKVDAIRGASGIFHPLRGHGDVKIKQVVELSGAGADDYISILHEEEDEHVEEPAEEVETVAVGKDDSGRKSRSGRGNKTKTRQRGTELTSIH
jgi:hypothetical protein